MKRQKYHAQWANLTSEKYQKPLEIKIAIRDLPGIQMLEDTLLVGKLSRDPVTRGKEEDMATQISIDLFGICDAHTDFAPPAHYNDLPEYSNERAAIDDAWYEYDCQYETEELTDDEIVIFFDSYNVDFRDGAGNPLRCTKMLSRTLEAVVKKIGGHMPDLSKFKEQNMERNLSDEVSEFLKRRNRSK